MEHPARTDTPTPPAACSLSQTGMVDQAARYRRLAADVVAAHRSAWKLEIELAPDVDGANLAQLVRVERGCCPFLDISYDAGARLLSLSVHDRGHAPVLNALAAQLGRG
jgi:hypothetical protein